MHACILESIAVKSRGASKPSHQQKIMHLLWLWKNNFFYHFISSVTVFLVLVDNLNLKGHMWALIFYTFHKNTVNIDVKPLPNLNQTWDLAF